MNCTFSPGHRQLTSRFPWTDSHVSIPEFFSRPWNLICLCSYCLQGSPHCLANRSNNSHSHYFYTNFPIKYPIKSLFYHIHSCLFLCFSTTLFFPLLSIVPVLSFPSPLPEEVAWCPGWKLHFFVAKKKKILTTKTSQRRKCSSSAAHTGKLVQQESGDIPERKYEIRWPERLGHFLYAFGEAFGLLLMVYPRSGCLATTSFLLFHLPGSWKQHCLRIGCSSGHVFSANHVGFWF